MANIYEDRGKMTLYPWQREEKGESLYGDQRGTGQEWMASRRRRNLTLTGAHPFTFTFTQCETRNPRISD